MTRHRREIHEHHERHRRRHRHPENAFQKFIDGFKHQSRHQIEEERRRQRADHRRLEHELKERRHPKHRVHERHHHINPFGGITNFITRMKHDQKHFGHESKQQLEKRRRRSHRRPPHQHRRHEPAVAMLPKLPHEFSGLKRKKKSTAVVDNAGEPAFLNKPKHPMQRGVKVVPPHHVEQYKYDPTVPPFLQKQLKNWPPKPGFFSDNKTIVTAGSVGEGPETQKANQTAPIKKLPPTPKPPLAHKSPHNPDPNPPFYRPPPPEESKHVNKEIKKPKGHKGSFSTFEHQIEKVSQ